MELSQRFSVAQLDEIEPVSCPCGMARRAFGDVNGETFVPACTLGIIFV